MKLSELKKPAGGAIPVPGGSVELSEDAADAVGSAAPSPAEEPQGVTTVTPSGIEIAYEWAPRRLYRLRDLADSTGQTVVDVSRDDPDYPWREVPSVTTVLGVLDKSGPLTWWGMKVGIDGSKALHEEGYTLPLLSTDEIVKLLTERKLTVNHVKDKAANRGVNVHSVLEEWTPGKTIAWDHRPEHEQGYVRGLADFLLQIEDAVEFGSLDMELMVGSLEHQYAGRFDLVLKLNAPTEVVTRCYPKRPPKVEKIPAGRYLMDLKTRKKASVYDTNFLQLEAYEHAAVECGYQPTDYRAVIVVTEDGGYQMSVNQDWCFEDFLAVRKVYSVLNEREVLRVLRDELDAKEVA